VNEHVRPHVLIVSDDQGLSGFLQEGLLIAGFWTSVVASSLQTLELFRLRTFDAMIVDVALEGLGADELVQRLRRTGESGPRTDIPIVAIAGSAAEISPELRRLLGDEAFILPPIGIADLAMYLFGIVRAWRDAHPDRPWSDRAAQEKT